MKERRGPNRAQLRVRRHQRHRRARQTNPQDDDSDVLLAVVAAVVAGALAVASAPRTRRIIGRSGNVQRVRPVWKTWCEAMTAGDFKLRFALSKELFAKLSNALRSSIEPKAIALGSGHTAARAIGCDLRLAVTLRFLRGGSYLDIELWSGIEQSTLRRIFTSTVKAMSECALLDNIKLPMSDEPEAQRLAADRFAPPGSPFHGALGAIDGVHIEVNVAGKSWINYKGRPSVLVQAVAGAGREFLYMSCNDKGAQSDTKALAFSSLATKMADGGFGDDYFLLGDGGYTSSEVLIIPFVVAGMTNEHHQFNYRQSQLRIVVECAFGMLKRRFGILWRPLECDISKVPELVTVLCRLHNLALSESTAWLSTVSRSGGSESDPSGQGSVQAPHVRMQANNSPGGALRAKVHSDRRLKIKNLVVERHGPDMPPSQHRRAVAEDKRAAADARAAAAEAAEAAKAAPWMLYAEDEDDEPGAGLGAGAGAGEDVREEDESGLGPEEEADGHGSGALDEFDALYNFPEAGGGEADGEAHAYESDNDDRGPALQLTERTDEELRAGDQIFYTLTVYVAGDPRGHTLARVTAVDPFGGQRIVGLDNNEALDGEQFVKIVARSDDVWDHEFVPHLGGEMRAVKLYSLVAGRLRNFRTKAEIVAEGVSEALGNAGVGRDLRA